MILPTANISAITILYYYYYFVVDVLLVSLLLMVVAVVVDDDDIISCCIHCFGISCYCQRWMSPITHWIFLLLLPPSPPLFVSPIPSSPLMMNTIVLIPQIIHRVFLLFHWSIRATATATATATAIRVGLVVSTAADGSGDSSYFYIRPAAVPIQVVLV